MPVALDRSAAASTKRLDSLTGARFLAALGVFLYHSDGVFPDTGPFGRALHLVGGNGSIGVDFFFALSGFVLAWSWRDGSSTRAFFRRRFARLAPAYWVALVYGFVWIVFLYRDPLLALPRTLPALVGLQAWFPDPSVHFAADGVEWSVSAELFFYLLFPVLIVLARSKRRLAVLVVLALGLGVIAPAAVPSVVPGDLGGWLTDICPAVRIGEFVCGLLLARALRSGRRVTIDPRIAALVFVGLYFVLPMAPAWVPRRALFLVAILAIIAALAQRDIDGRGTLLAARVPVRLGEWSYCFYLVHQMTLEIALLACGKVVPGRAFGPVWLLVALLASVALSALLYHLVEHPFERRLRAPHRRGSEAEPSGGLVTA